MSEIPEYPIELQNGNLLVPMRAEREGKLIGDGLVEVEPGTEDYEAWDKYRRNTSSQAGRDNGLLNALLNGLKSLTCALKQTAGANRYRRDLRGAVQNLWNGSISGSDFLRVLKYQLIPLAFEQAWKDGAEAAGIAFDELTDAEKDRLKARITEEKAFVKGFRDYIVAHDKAAGYKLSSLWPRTDLWVNRYTDVVNEARMMAGGDKKLVWRLRPAEHCTSCLKLANQVRRGSFWRDHDCRPQHPDLECMHSAGGPTVCKCEFEETDERCSSGPLPSWRA